MGKKNEQIKKAGVMCEYTQEQVLEMAKCLNDPIYFIEKYIRIQHPTQGAVNFKLYDFQRDLIKVYNLDEDSIVLASRQVGKTTTVSAYLLWFAIFHFDKTVMIASNKDENAMELIKRIKYQYENLPMWIKPGVMEDGYNMHQIAFDNDSRIISTATSITAGRTFAISLLYLDEFAFVQPEIQDEFWTSISPTLATGGKCIITSTPNGDTNLFAELWRGAIVGSNGFKHMHIKWQDPPDRDETFRKKMIGKLGMRKWLQEFETKFLSSDALLIDPLVLERLTKEMEGIEPIKKLRDVSFWEDIKDGLTYLVSVDPATGSGDDFSVIHVYSFPELIQVAEYRSNTMSTNDLYTVLKNILKYIEDKGSYVFFSVENNGVGEGVMALHEADETPAENAELVNDNGKRRGMTTTLQSKMKSCVNFKEMVERGTMKIRSKVMLAEMKSFVKTRGAFAAQRGSTDDCISASLIMTRIVEEISTFDAEAFKKLYGKKVEKWEDDSGEWDVSDYPNTGNLGDEYNDSEAIPLVFG